MNIENTIKHKHERLSALNSSLLRSGLDGLRPYQEKLDDLLGVLETLETISDADTARTAQKLAQQLRAVEASVTMIGQVKAGKTSLVNAMAGWPELLPADVNPWTSVVTSLHLNPDPYPQGNHASFRFFDQEEWDRLMERGGRVGELASRTGADDELEKVRRQIEEMREKSRRRLGKKFELLLGETHDYGYFDGDLIERYVCLGDDFEDDIDLSSNQGRFADITKSADLFLHRPEIPVPLCIRDTPGVNDTFMMREQITIRAIRESRICVVVLSAHQALSSVDMALIRLISNVKSREVIIFVNRIDELSNPTEQVPEIRASIEKTLKAHHGPDSAQIIFGSAYWANAALSGGMDMMTGASAASLLDWAEGALTIDSEALSAEEMVWELSGLPDLYRAIAERIEEGVGHETINRTARRAINLTSGVRARSGMAFADGADPDVELDEGAFEKRLAEIEQRAMGALSSRFEEALADFHRRMDRSHKSFLDRATSALVTHLESYGDEAVWSYDPTGLRVLLRSAYQVFGKNAQKICADVLTDAADELRDLYCSSFHVDPEQVAIETPMPPRIAPPVLLGQTIALDLKGNWWTRWWQRRRGYRAYAMEFAEMIRAETDPIISGLKDAHSAAAREDASRLLREFLSDQRAILSNLATVDGRAEASALGADQKAALEQTMATLTRFAA